MSPALRRILPWIGLALLCVFYLGEIGGHPLQDPDEGRYAEIPREMIESGDWVTPRLNYVAYFEKPPLVYWLVALSFELFGMSEGAARAVPAVAGILTVVIAFVLGRRLVGTRGAALGAGVLATSPIFFVLAQALTIDMVLTACTTATLASFWGAHRAARKSPWVLAVAAFAALGVLAKGPVALVLPGMIALVFLLWWRDWSTLRALVRPLPIAVFAVAVVPWFVLAARANPEFLHFFFVREHFERFTADVGHPEGPFYYVPILLLGPLPWTAVAIALACTRDGRAAWREIPRDARAFLLLWGVLVVGFFTVASSKLATYILPALPPFALVAGAWLDRVLERPALASRLNRWLGTAMFVLGAFAVLAAVIAWPLESAFADAFDAGGEDVRAIAGATLRTGLAFGVLGWAVSCSRSGARLAAPVALWMLVFAMGLGTFGALSGRAVVKTSEELGRVVAQEARPGDLVVLYKKLWQGMPFYTERRIGMIRNYDEVWHGVSIASDRDRELHYWSDLEPLVREWESGRRVFLLTNRELVPEVARRVEPAPRLLARDKRRVVVVNFPEDGDGDRNRAGLRERSPAEAEGSSGGR